MGYKDKYKFRAKKAIDKKWLTGLLFRKNPLQSCCEPYGQQQQPEYFILSTNFTNWRIPRQVVLHKVSSDTIGQSTGATELAYTSHGLKKGKVIFDGDILKIQSNHSNPEIVLVCWSAAKGGWTWLFVSGSCMAEEDIQKVEIIGNKWDNPEMLVTSSSDIVVPDGMIQYN